MNLGTMVTVPRTRHVLQTPKVSPTTSSVLAPSSDARVPSSDARSY